MAIVQPDLFDKNITLIYFNHSKARGQSMKIDAYTFDALKGEIE